MIDKYYEYRIVPCLEDPSLEGMVEKFQRDWAPKGWEMVWRMETTFTVRREVSLWQHIKETLKEWFT
jgi:hypothetical protein